MSQSQATPGLILVVDDNVGLAENIAEILSDVGHPTAVCLSAEAALERIRAGGVTAVVTDYRLPGMSGADLIAALRRAGISIPVVVMSAYTDPAIIERAEQFGATDVMPKPVDIARLMRIVAAFGRASDVLVVDDNVALAENLAEALRAKGFEPVIGHNAREALAAARPRVAVIDYRLPDRSGLQVAKQLLARDPAIRIRLVTAYLDDLRAAAARELPEVECLTKPVDLNELLAWAGSAVADRKPIA